MTFVLYELLNHLTQYY